MDMAKYMRDRRRRDGDEINRQRREWYAANKESINARRRSTYANTIAKPRIPAPRISTPAPEKPVPSATPNEMLGERLLRLRLTVKLSQRGLADHIGVCWHTIQQWEKGRAAPRAPAVTVLASALRVTNDYLLTGRESPRHAALLAAIRASTTVTDRRILAFLEPAANIP